jgi:hypothetical protein
MPKKETSWEELAPSCAKEWLHIRESNTHSQLSTWELDDMYLEFALVHFPKDMVIVSRGGYKAQGARSNMRIRYQSWSLLWDTLFGDEDAS